MIELQATYKLIREDLARYGSLTLAIMKRFSTRLFDANNETTGGGYDHSS